MAPKVSKNAKVNRSATVKFVVMHAGKEVEVCPASFIGKTAGMRNYMAVQEKATKLLLLDEAGMPLEWNKTIIDKRNIG
jgi:hypothetical protein